MTPGAVKWPLTERKDNQEFPVPDTSLWEPLEMGACFGLVLVWVRAGDKGKDRAPCWWAVKGLARI